MRRGRPTARPPEGPARSAIRLIPSDKLRADEEAALRELFDEAWSDDAEGGFTDQDWGHAVGGVHVIAEADGHMVAHASVVNASSTRPATACRPGTSRPSPPVPAINGRGSAPG
jgi:hypothetical protein